MPTSEQRMNMDSGQLVQLHYFAWMKMLYTIKRCTMEVLQWKMLWVSHTLLPLEAKSG